MTHPLLLPLLRQYLHNDASGLVTGYDKAGVDALVLRLLATRQPASKSLPSIPTDAMCRAAREKIGIGSNIAGHAWRIMASEFSGSVAPVAAAVQGEATQWEQDCSALQNLISDIGTILGADMSRELVKQVAQRRMEELAAARRSNLELQRRYDEQKLQEARLEEALRRAK